MINTIFGLEIEFITDKSKLLKALKDNNIPYAYYEKQITIPHSILVLKKEATLNHPDGIEINFPPSRDFELVKKVLNILNKLDISFNNKCALHVHIDFNNKNINDIFKVHNYYAEHQNDIINNANEKGLYINLNNPITKGKINSTNRMTNLNSLLSFKKHRTIEHRIYKSTINFDDVVFCVEQTKNIIDSALK